MDNMYTQKVIDVNNIFDTHFLNTKNLYLYCFNVLPSVHFIGAVDGEKILSALNDTLKHLVVHQHDYRRYEKKQKEYPFNTTILILKNNCIVELYTNYCEILHDGSNPEFVEALTKLANQCKERQRRQPLEINLIVNGPAGIDLKAMEIKRTQLDIGLYYEDDFKEADETIRKRLNKKNDKGIVLLHGLPGTGKTTYLRYLIGKIKKRVLFLSPSVAGNLMNPEFIELLIDNPNTVVVIEDAENILMDRKTNNSSAVSNLLNISDGLLADFLSVQLICTFNNSLTLVDNALMRKGRLIAKYEFGKLGIKKAQQLSDRFGFKTTITQPMTIAEIANQHEKETNVRQVEVIGFRRSIMEN